MHSFRKQIMRTGRADRGAITVETALTATVVMFLLAALGAFGGAALSQIRAGESARIVARAVAAGETESTARERGLVNSPGAQILITVHGETAAVTVQNTVSGVGQILSRGAWTVAGHASTTLENTPQGAGS